jgi:hypothetical protein
VATPSWDFVRFAVSLDRGPETGPRIAGAAGKENGLP